jgi:hypothetical protein
MAASQNTGRGIAWRLLFARMAVDTKVRKLNRLDNLP